MIGLDTNILLRAAAQDDAVQSPMARGLIESLDEVNPGYVNMVVLAEFAWNLRTRFKYERVAILDAIEAMMQSAAFVLADRDAVNAALSRSREQRMDMADALIGELNRVAGCRTTMSFDKGARARDLFTELG